MTLDTIYGGERILAWAILSLSACQVVKSNVFIGRRVEIIRVETKDMFAGGECFFVAFEVEKSYAFAAMRLYMVGIEAKDMFIGSERFFVALSFVMLIAYL
jgi:hypothetical protein